MKPVIAGILAIAVLITGFWYPGYFRGGRKDGGRQESLTGAPGGSTQNSGAQGQGGTSGKTSGKSSGQSENREVLKEERGMVTEEQPVVTLCGVTLNAELLDLSEGGLEAVVQDQGSGKTEDGRSFHQFDIQLGNRHEQGGPVEVTYRVKDPLNCIVTHYREDMDTWMPLVGKADSETGELTVLASSFTPQRVERAPEKKEAVPAGEVRGSVEQAPDDPNALGPLYYVKEPGKPTMHYEISSQWVDILGARAKPNFSESMARFTKSPTRYRLEMPEVDIDGTPEQMISGFEGASSWWGLISPFIDVGVSLTPMEKSPMAIALVDGRFQPYEANFKTNLSNAMTDISLLTMGLQVCTDSYQYGFDSPTTALNAYKNLLNNAGTIFTMHTGYASSALTIGFLGVSIFSMQLDYMVETAKETQSEITEDIFNSYYKNIHPFKWKPWYQFFEDMYWRGDMDARAAMDAVNYKLDEYAAEFWKEASESSDDFIFAISESKYRNYFDIPQEQKDLLTAKLKIDVRKRFRKEVLPRIERFLLERSQEQLYKSVAKPMESFNRELNFTIKENVDMTTTAVPEYLGCAMAFGKNGKIIDADGWVLDAPSGKDAEDGWTMEFTATELAWMCANLPDTLYIYKDRKALAAGKDPIHEVHFELNTKPGDRNTIINLSDDATYTWVQTKIKIMDPFNGKLSELSMKHNEAYTDGEYVDLYYRFPAQKIKSIPSADGTGTGLVPIDVDDEVEDGPYVVEAESHHHVIQGPGQVVDYPEQFVYTYTFDYSATDPEGERNQSAVIVREGLDGEDWDYFSKEKPEGKAFDKEVIYPDGETANRHSGGKVVPEARSGGRITITVISRDTLVLFEYTAVPVDEAGNYHYILEDTYSRKK